MGKKVSRRDFLKTAGAVFASTMMAGLAKPARAEELNRPNIVFIMADDLGWMDTSLYGSKFYETPNIDSLAQRGMMFTNAYAANPLCSPTRASIMTGLYPSRIGITTAACHQSTVRLETGPAASATGGGGKYHLALSVTRLKQEYFVLPEALKLAGYATGHFGKWHLGLDPYNPENQGYDVDKPHHSGPGPACQYIAPWCFSSYDSGGTDEHIEDRMADEAIQFMQDNQSGPFFLSYWAFSVHAPHDPVTDVKPDKLAKYQAKVDPTSMQRNPVNAGMIEALDDSVGRLIDKIDELGLTDNTIIVFFSDNGGIHWHKYDDHDSPITSNYPLTGGKASIYEGGIREPLVFVWPGVVQPGSVSDEIVSSIDFHPTFLDILGLAAQTGQEFDGISIVPALQGTSLNREAIFWHFPHKTGVPYNLDAVSAVRKGPWKLIRMYYANEDWSHGYKLFNLDDDISEYNNLADTNPEKVAELDALIEKFLADTGSWIPIPDTSHCAFAEKLGPLDKNGNCEIDLEDLGEFTKNWLNCARYPDSSCF